MLTGGSPLPFAMDQFFQSLGVAVLEGYWMAEAAHMAACRRLEFTGQRSRLTPRTVGPVLAGRIVNAAGRPLAEDGGGRS